MDFVGHLCEDQADEKSVLLYACETWRITKALTHKVQTFINRCLRAILHIKWQDKITNEEIWRRTGQAESQIKKIKWDWLAGPRPAKTNVQRSMPCSKMEPTRETEERKTPAPPGESLWRLKGGHWDTSGVSWKLCPEIGASGGSLWSTYAPHGVQGYKPSQVNISNDHYILSTICKMPVKNISSMICISVITNNQEIMLNLLF